MLTVVNKSVTEARRAFNALFHVLNKQTTDVDRFIIFDAFCLTRSFRQHVRIPYVMQHNAHRSTKTSRTSIARARGSQRRAAGVPQPI